MFQLTHVYSAAKAHGKEPYYLLGSVLGDLPIVSRSLDWGRSTGMQAWFGKLKNPYLKKGLISHMKVDYVSHGELSADFSKGTGYAFRWLESRFPRLKATNTHNLPEYLLELYVAKEHMESFNLLNYAVKSVKLKDVAEDLAQAAHYPTEVIDTALRWFIGFTKIINGVTRTYSHLADSGQGRKETLQDCIAACKKII